MRISDSRICSYVVISFMIAIAMATILAKGEEKDKRQAIAPVLMIATCVDRSPTALALIVRNEGKENLTTTRFGTRWNRIVIVKPDGQKIEEFLSHDPVPRVIIPPSKTKTWHFTLHHNVDHLGKPVFNMPGIYKIRWKLGTYHPQPTEWFLSKVLLLKENEKKDSEKKIIQTNN